MAKKQELLTISGRTFSVDDYFRVNFGELAETITRLANRDTALTDQDKELAVKVIDDWSRDVVDQIRNKKQLAEHLVTSLNVNNSSCYRDMNELEQIAHSAGCTKQFDLFKSAEDLLGALRQEDKDIRSKYDGIDLREPGNFEVYRMYKEETIEMNKKIVTAERESRKSLRVLIVALNKDATVKNTIAKCNGFLGNVDVLITEATNKANMARVNVTIDNQEVRNALLDLLEFQI